MSWHKEFLSENQNKNVLSNKSGLFKLIEEVYSEKLTKKEKSLISEDFIQNTLFEIFSGIDYNNLIRRPINDRIQEYSFRIGMALILGFMVFVTLNDIKSIFNV